MDSTSKTFTTNSVLKRFTLTGEDFLKQHPNIHAIIAGIIVFREPLDRVTSAQGPRSNIEEKGSDGEYKSHYRGKLSYPKGSTPSILLVRRAATDSWPLLWESPGGTVDPEDESIIHTAARELHEEANLLVKHFYCTIGLGVDHADDISQFPVSTPEVASKQAQNRSWMEDDLCVFKETGDTWAKVTFLVDAQNTDDVRVRADEHAEWRWATEEEVRRGSFADGAPLDFVSDGVWSTLLEAFRVRRQILASPSEE